MAAPQVTEDQLRRWIRGELSRAEGRQVARFVVRCRDPRLPGLLQGMAEELKEERADARLSARGPAWAGLVDAWTRLLDSAAAAWRPATGGLVLAGAEDDGAYAIGFRTDPHLLVEITPPDPGDLLLVVATDDTGRASRLHGPGGAAPLLAAPDPLPPRWTVWAVWGPAAEWAALADTSDPLDLLQRCIASEALTVRAARPYDAEG